MTIGRKKFAKMLGIPEITAPDGRHILARSEAESAPHAKWNCFIDIISADPNSIQIELVRFASLIFLYESEVQNGGHDQYFHNTNAAFAEESIQALENFGDSCRSNVLAMAYDNFKSNPEIDLDHYDAKFHACTPELIEILERHFEHNEALYIEWKRNR